VAGRISPRVGTTLAAGGYDVLVDTAQRAVLETLLTDYGVQVGRLLGET